ncbi:MAG: low temperature requirement protein A [Pseudomonadota bacterium]
MSISTWQKPALRRDEEEARARKVSWLELFYDLVFVVVIAQLSSGLAADVGWHGLFYFALPFVPAWWLWIGGTMYTERFETEDVGHRLITFLQMMPVAVMAVVLHHGIEGGSGGFAVTYAAGRLLIIGIWLRGGLHNPQMRPVTNRYALGFSISVLIFLGSLLVPAPARYALWCLALVIDLLTPLFTLQQQKRLPRFSTSRLPERLGLFTIIVLGETIVGVVTGLAEVQHLTLEVAAVGLLGMTMAFAVWWLYFDGVSHQPPRAGLRWSLARNYLHLPLVLGITAIGAAVLQVVEHVELHLASEVRWLLCGATATVLVSLGLLMLVVDSGGAIHRLRPVHTGMVFAAAVVAVVLAVVGGGLGAVPLLACLLGVLVALVVGDVALRVRETE